MIICILALATAGLSVQAQNSEVKRNPNPWFVQGQLGASYSTGNTGIGQLLAPYGTIAGGKQFSPVWSARLAVSGWNGRAGSETSGQARGFFYGAATVDGLMNLSQLIRLYPERLFDVSLIGGIGLNRTFTGNVMSSFMGRLGLQGAFRMNEALDLNIEALVNGASDRWNGLNDHSFDSYITLGIGFTYRIGTNYKCLTCVSEEVIDVPYSPEEVNALVNEARAQAQAAAEQRVDTVIVKEECPPVTKEVRGLQAYVSFDIRQTQVSGREEKNVLAIAEYMKKFPDTQVTVTGYADTGTGSREINLRLAKERTDSVVKMLTEKYGIDRNRLTVGSMQGDEQLFATNNWNRVVVMVAE
jgi:outer membrane protein OmpA-like peptidoglycan-associated protein